MAENDILVYKFDELDNCLNKMGQVAEALDTVRKEYENMKNGISDYWQGDACEAYVSRFDETNNAIDKLYQQIDTNRKKLDKAISIERQNEEDIGSGIVGGLSADNIF